MKRYSALAVAGLLALPLMAGCVSSNSAEGRQAEAYARCRYSPGPKERESCIRTELALIEARERREAESLKSDQAATEERQAILEASGVPHDKAAEAVRGPDTAPDH